jgi:surface protein
MWNVLNGKNFDYMFYGCKSFDSDLSNWNVKNADSWVNFESGSLLEKHPEKMPKF